MIEASSARPDIARQRVCAPKGRAWAGLLRTWLVGLLGLCALGAGGQALAQSADLLVNQVPAPAALPAGGVVTYNVTVTNNGPNAATAVVLSDTMDAGATVLSATPSGGGSCGAPAATFTCNWPSLNSGASVTVAVQVRLPTVGVWNNAVSVSSATPDPTPDNNRLSRFATATAAADLVLTASTSAPGAGIAAGAPYTYTLDVNNAGPNALPAGEATTVTFAVPTGAAITARPAGPGWTCTPATGYPLTSGTVTCTRSDALASGAAFTAITVPAVTTTAGTISGSFNVRSTFPDGELTNNTRVVSVTALPGTDMSVAKTASPSGTVALGQPVTYTITPRYEGGAAPASGTGEVITVTDTLPATLTYVSHSAPAPWVCAYSAPTLTCRYPGPYTGSNFSNLPAIQLVATPNTEANGVANTATVAVPSDANASNDSGTATVDVSNKADLITTKRASINPVTVGQPYNFTVSVRNAGPVPVAAGQTLTVTDSIPAGITMRAPVTTGGWTCTPNTGFPQAGPFDLTCTRAGPLAVGGSVAFDVPVVNTVNGALTNTACVALSGAGPTDPTGNTGNSCASSGVTTSTTTADLVASKTASGTVFAGDNLTYVITVRNDGPDPATNVGVNDTVANLLATGGVQSVTPSQGACSQPAGPFPLNVTTATISCNLGTLANRASATVTVVVKPANTTSADLNRTNTAIARSADVGDTEQPNNTANVTSVVSPRVDVRVTKSAPATIKVGEPLTYVLTAINDGPSTAATVRITDVMPPNTHFLSAGTPSGGGSCPTVPAVGSAGQTLACEWPSIPPRTQYTVTVRVRPLPAAQGSNIVNTVNITTATTESNSGNNSGQATTAVTAALADIAVTKADTVDPIPLGTDTEYVITMRNLGPSYAHNLVMTDSFPSGGNSGAVFAYRGGLTVTPAGGTCTEPALGATTGVLACTFAGIDVNEVITVRYRMQASAITDPAAYSAPHYNRVTVAVDEPEAQPNNNATVEFTTTRRDPIANDLSVTLTPSAPALTPGTPITFTMTVKNEGTNAMSGQAVFTLPPGLVLPPAAPLPAGCTLTAPNQITCAVTNLSPGASQPFAITLDVPAGYTGGAATATASVFATGDQVSSNNNASATVLAPGSGGVTGVPTLGEWGLLLLSLLAAVAGLRQMRRQGR